MKLGCLSKNIITNGWFGYSKDSKSCPLVMFFADKRPIHRLLTVLRHSFNIGNTLVTHKCFLVLFAVALLHDQW